MKKITILILVTALAVVALLLVQKGRMGKAEPRASFRFPAEYRAKVIGVARDATSAQQPPMTVKMFYAGQKVRNELPNGDVVITRKDIGVRYGIRLKDQTFVQMPLPAGAADEIWDLFPKARAWKFSGTERVGGAVCEKYKCAFIRPNMASFLLTCWVDKKTKTPVQIGFHVLEGKSENEKYPDLDQLIKLADFQKGKQDLSLFEPPQGFKKAQIKSQALAVTPEMKKLQKEAEEAAKKIGAPVPNFTLKGSDGEMYSLKEYQNTAVVLEWINYDCPYVKALYESGKIQELQKEIASKTAIKWLAICSSAPGKPGYYSSEKINELNEKYGSYVTAYLIDDTGEVGKKYGVGTTPHMFVVNRGLLIYGGPMEVLSAPKKEMVGKSKNYLRAAIQAVIEGRWPNAALVDPQGTSIPYVVEKSEEKDQPSKTKKRTVHRSGSGSNP